MMAVRRNSSWHDNEEPQQFESIKRLGVGTGNMNAKEDAVTKKVRSFNKGLEQQTKHESQSRLFDAPVPKFKSTRELLVNNQSIVQ